MPIRKYIVETYHLPRGCTASTQVLAYTAEDALAQVRLHLPEGASVLGVGPAADSNVGGGPPPMFTLTSTGESRPARLNEYYLNGERVYLWKSDCPSGGEYPILRLDRCDGAPL